MEGNSPEQPGIEQCGALVTELEARKTKGTGAAASAASTQPGAAVPAAGAADMDIADDAKGLEPSASDVHVAEGTDELDDMDPIRLAAEKKVESALLRLNYYALAADMASSLGEVVQESQKILVLIDAPTSKARVGVRLVDDAAKILEPGVGKCHESMRQ